MRTSLAPHAPSSPGLTRGPIPAKVPRPCREGDTSTRRRLPIAIALLAALAACATPTRPPPVDRPDLYVPTDAPVPFAVRQLLPSGVLASDVRVRDNCYGYAAGGTVYPVIVPRSGQYCI